MSFLNKITSLSLLLITLNVVEAKSPSEPAHIEQIFNPILVEDIKRSVDEKLNSPYEYTRSKKNIFENSNDQRRFPAGTKGEIEVAAPVVNSYHSDQW